MASSAKKGMMNRYSPKSVGNQAKVPSNGHCPKSPTGAHWWLIESPDGKSSAGVCKYCGAVKEFLNIWVRPFTQPDRDRSIELKENNR